VPWLIYWWARWESCSWRKVFRQDTGAKPGAGTDAHATLWRTEPLDQDEVQPRHAEQREDDAGHPRIPAGLCRGGVLAEIREVTDRRIGPDDHPQAGEEEAG
jgi:hypothetical protein